MKPILGYRGLRLSFFLGHCIFLGDPALPQRKWLSLGNGKPPMIWCRLEIQGSPLLFPSLPFPYPHPSHQQIQMALFSERTHSLATSHPSLPLAPAHNISPGLIQQPPKLLLPCWPHCNPSPYVLSSSLISGDNNRTADPVGWWEG